MHSWRPQDKDLDKLLPQKQNDASKTALQFGNLEGKHIDFYTGTVHFCYIWENYVQ